MQTKTILLMTVFFLITGLYDINVSAHSLDEDISSINYDLFEDISEDLILYSTTEGRAPVRGLDDDTVYNVKLVHYPDFYMTVSNSWAEGTNYRAVTTSKYTDDLSQGWRFEQEEEWGDGVYRMHSNRGGTLNNLSNVNNLAVIDTSTSLRVLVIRDEFDNYKLMGISSNGEELGFLGLEQSSNLINEQLKFLKDYRAQDIRWKIEPESEREAKPEPDKISLSLLLEENEEIQLSVTKNLTDNKDLTWSSSNKDVAIVDINGKVKAVSKGTTNIKAKNKFGFEESIPLLVVGEGEAEGLRLAVNLNVSETAKLYMDVNNNVIWSSLNPDIVRVDSSGRITAISEGLAIIKAEHQGVHDNIYVRVTK